MRELNNSLNCNKIKNIDKLKDEHQKELDTIELNIKKIIENKCVMKEKLKAQLKNEQHDNENTKSKFDKHRMNLISALE